MGLDMYLTAKRYLSQHDDYEKEIADKIGRLKINDRDGKLRKMVPKGFRVKQVEVEACYWRKSNQIHQWFVDNLGGGEDNCQEMYVSKEKLQALVDVCNEVLADHAKAPGVLPTAGGFFFGGTEYDEWYYKDLEETVETLTKVIEAFDERYWSLYYRASW
jgi:hypothetical protein